MAGHSHTGGAMAKSTTGKTASSIGVWIIVLLLIVGLAGFGAGGFGGTVRTIGSVGDTDISTDRYANALRQELSALTQQTGRNFTLAEAQAFGLDRAVLQQVIATTALENEASDLGLSVGDAAVSREVLRLPGFQSAAGFDRDSYEMAVRQSGQTVAEFESGIRRDTARTLLQTAVVAGAETPDTFTDTLYSFARQTRDLTYVQFAPGDLETPLPAPDEADLRAFYDDNPDTFLLPEQRRITYAWLTPDMMMDDVAVDDEALRRLYEERLDEFVQPERRLVERLVFESEENAQAARDAIEAGETDFETLVQERGLSLSDIDLGDLSRAQLGSAADAVFALDEPGIAGPVTTDLGPALMRMNGILSAQEVTFEEAREELVLEFADGAARRLVNEQIDMVDDLLAGGATLEDLAAETPLELGTVLFSDETEAPIARYNDFRVAASAAEVGDFPEVVQIEEGGIFALRLDEIVPPARQPFDEVQAEVILAWEASETEKALRAQAEALLAEVESGADLVGGATDPVEVTGVLRDAFLEDTPDVLITTVFEMTEGELRVISADGGAWLVRLDAVQAPDLASDEAQQIRAGFAEQTAQSYAQDMIDAFTLSVQSKAGIALNETAINAVNTQFP